MPDYTGGGGVVDAGALEDSYIELFKARDPRAARLWEYAEILYSAGKLTADDVAGFINDVLLYIDKIAYDFDRVLFSVDFVAKILDSANLSADKAASILDNANLSVDKAASILDNANLSETKLQAILDNENLSIQRGQEIVDAMSNKEKIGTGGRRGYLADDWEDNKLTNRDRAATLATTFDRIFQKFRPEWDTVSGTPEVSNGRLFFDNSLEMQVPSDFVVGAWQFKFEWSESSDTDESYCFIRFMYVDDDNTYFLKLDAFVSAETRNGLGKIVNGVGSGLLSFAIDLGEHTIKITRDSDGNFEVFYDGVSKGTATDTNITTSNYINIKYTQKTYGNLYLDDLEVY